MFRRFWSKNRPTSERTHMRARQRKPSRPADQTHAILPLFNARAFPTQALSKVIPHASRPHPRTIKPASQRTLVYQKPSLQPTSPTVSHRGFSNLLTLALGVFLCLFTQGTQALTQIGRCLRRWFDRRRCRRFLWDIERRFRRSRLRSRRLGCRCTTFRCRHRC